ncbi:MAG TPA: long-chain fatty acid--CoA ligase, partial [Actinomycetota bacterium]|nr:long-chain fatty acid--CoA ligase [Actinomycetota bacterium]
GLASAPVSGTPGILSPVEPRVATLPDLLLGAAAEHGDRIALRSGDRPIAYAEVAEWVCRAASGLAELGVRRGDRVAMLVGNVPEFVYALYGAQAAGAVVAPLNVMLTPEEVGYILADADAKVVIAQIDYLPTVLAVRDRVASIEHVLVVGPPPTPRGTRSFDELLDRARPRLPEVEVASEDLAVLAYTAGTTASPKGAMLTHGNLLANLEQISRVPAFEEDASDVVLAALPLFHSYALNVVLGVTFMAGATAVLVERFDPLETLRLIERHHVTILFGAPPMFHAWVEAAERAEADLSSVRLAVSGASALPERVLQAFRERFGMTIMEGYGLTEAGPAVTTNAMGEARPGSIGLPLPGVEVRLLDEDGEEVADGDPGEILVRGPNIFLGYWGRPEESEAVLRDGWLHTGDVAYRDDDGYLHVVDRKKDLVIVSGFNVFPKEVEDAILAHPDVADCVVVGEPDERTGERVVAYVVAAPGAAVTEEEVREHCAGFLARFKVPRRVEVVDELPKHATGKVLRRELREAKHPEGVA